jgi:hypothetical protein
MRTLALFLLILITSTCLAQEDGVPRYPGASKVHPTPITYPDLYSTDDTVAKVDSYYSAQLKGWEREEIDNASSDDGYGVIFSQGEWSVSIWKIQGRTYFEITRLEK